MATSAVDERPCWALARARGDSTKYGLLTANAVNGNVPRSIGTMPETVRLDINLSRTYGLPSGKTILALLHSMPVAPNLLNHSDPMAVNTILSSEAAGRPGVSRKSSPRGTGAVSRFGLGRASGYSLKQRKSTKALGTYGRFRRSQPLGLLRGYSVFK